MPSPPRLSVGFLSIFIILSAGNLPELIFLLRLPPRWRLPMNREAALHSRRLEGKRLAVHITHALPSTSSFGCRFRRYLYFAITVREWFIFVLFVWWGGEVALKTSCHKQSRWVSPLGAQLAIFHRPRISIEKNFSQCLETERMNHSAIKLYADVAESIVLQRTTSDNRKLLRAQQYRYRDNRRRISTQLTKAKVESTVKIISITFFMLRGWLKLVWWK